MHSVESGAVMSKNQGLFIEDLSVGQSATITKTISESDINRFAEISGDTNPVHLDQEYAASTVFKGRIAHGMLTAGLISAVIGTRLPGPGSIYISQSLFFKGPVRIGDTVETTVTVAEIILAKKRVRLACSCAVGGKVVLDGEAVIMVPSRA
jgi:3-hydroxybutyryl-CoA dehydratase